MQTTTRQWILDTISQLPDREIEQLKDYLEFLTWKSKREKPQGNLIAKGIIDAMRQPPHVTHEDGEALMQAINEGK
ncbi:hypothetical protein [Candidatus Entotheonella palauensis]|uniref:hypothetical protein n=1 Tax=Candidatus Entotheonella palauensis TaxID=93172 RepID=UPI000B7F1CAB|nr:hypothetical protein [Candidatus Entotheonella palauensis]